MSALTRRERVLRVTGALRGGILLIAANCLGLFLNYFHQAQAAALLTTEAFGRFNVWLGLVGIGNSLGYLAQFASNFFVFSHAFFVRWRLGSAALSLGLVLLCLLLRWEPHASVLAIAAILLNVLLNASTGQYQARLRFGVMAFAAIFLFGTRALVPNVTAQADEGAFYLATPMAYLLTLIALGPVRTNDDSASKAEPSARPSTVKTRLGAAAILALCGASFPMLDILWVAWVAPGDSAGRFAQVSLFTRVPYLLGALILQVTLPYHVQDGRRSETDSRRPIILRLELVALAAAVACAPLNALVVPWAARRMLGINLAGETSAILLSSINFAALLALFRAIQLSCSRGALRMPLIVLTSLFVPLLLARTATSGNVVGYLLWALATYTSAAIASHLLIRRAAG